MKEQRKESPAGNSRLQKWLGFGNFLRIDADY